MKTVFIIFYDLGIGGIQRKIIDMVRYIRTTRKGIRVVVILKHKPLHGNREGEAQAEGAMVHRYYDSILSHIRFMFPLYTLLLAYRYRPVAVFSFSLIPAICGLVIKLLYSRSTVSVIDIDGSPGEYELNQRFSSIRSFLMKYTYPRADAVITVNASIRDELMRITGMTASSITVLPNWHYSTKLHEPAFKRVWDIVYVGRLEKIKQIDRLISMIVTVRKRYSNIRMCIVGEGTQKSALQQLTARYGIGNQVEFMGFQHDTQAFIRRAKLFIHPSRNEGMSFALLEAMALGTPVVCNGFPSCDELIQHGINGMVYHTQEEGSRIILDLLRNPRKRAQLADKAMKTARKNYSEKRIKGYLDLLGI